MLVVGLKGLMRLQGDPDKVLQREALITCKKGRLQHLLLLVAHENPSQLPTLSGIFSTTRMINLIKTILEMLPTFRNV